MNTELLRNCRAELAARVTLLTAAMADLDLILEQTSAPQPAAGPRSLARLKVTNPPDRYSLKARTQRKVRSSPPPEPGGLSAALEHVLPKLVTPFTAIDVRAALREHAPDLDSHKFCNLSMWLKRAVKNGRLCLEKDGLSYTPVCDRTTAPGPRPALDITKRPGPNNTEPSRKRLKIDVPPPERANDIEEAVRMSVSRLALNFRIPELLEALERDYAALYRHAEPGVVRDELKHMTKEGLLEEVPAADGKPLWRKSQKHP